MGKSKGAERSAAFIYSFQSEGESEARCDTVPIQMHVNADELQRHLEAGERKELRMKFIGKSSYTVAITPGRTFFTAAIRVFHMRLYTSSESEIPHLFHVCFWPREDAAV